MTSNLLVQTLGLAFALSACATTAPDLEGGSGGGGKADDGTATTPDAATRAKILDAIHRDYLDPAVHDQANEVVVERIAVAGEFAWVTGSVQRQGGGDLDWDDSEFADDVADGLFDGPSLQALVHAHDGAWSVSEASLGATDVWWDGIWYRYPTSCGLFPGFDCPTVITPAPGTAARRELIRAIHEQGLDASLHGQPNELVVSWMRAGGDYAFATATVQAVGGGELDWSDSDYADDLEEGLFDGPNLSVFMEQTAEGWKVHALDVGATDVSWYGAWERFSAVPCALFPVDACPASE
ncbi:MAG: hypothetical protein SFX73_04575 [Kofleriaceae bacterium]|nr:hypothetical protein [Kofleriaceae bacterium]